MVTYESGRYGVENGVESDAHHELLELARLRSVLDLHHVSDTHETDQTAEKEHGANGEESNQRQDNEAAQHRRIRMADVTDSTYRVAVDAVEHENGDCL